MSRGAIGPGDDVEAWCTRCRMNLNHRVIAVTSGGIQRVVCLTCNGDHKYHPPKSDKSLRPEAHREKVNASGSSRSPRPAVDRSAARMESEWNTFMKDMPPAGLARPYRVTECYDSGEFVEHPVFGMGKVLGILGAERVEIIFREGRKVMICNRPAVQPES
jgi:hypothetical protein